jgi:thiol-disulfide isomerase/thioredoxin
MSIARILALASLVAAIPGVRPALAHDWNEKAIAWQPYEVGLAAAKKERKAVLLVIFTEWCPHCKNYAELFHDAKVVDASKKFVMIHVDKDKQPDISKRYAPDGEYIPRTYFLSSDGKLDESIKAPREKFVYFYDEKNPAGILAAMAEAEKKLK